MIDWKKFAEINNLTPEEFQRDILTAAACVGVSLIEQGAIEEADTLKFTCSDNVGKIGVFIRRLDEQHQQQGCNENVEKGLHLTVSTT